MGVLKRIAGYLGVLDPILRGKQTAIPCRVDKLKYCVKFPENLWMTFWTQSHHDSSLFEVASDHRLFLESGHVCRSTEARPRSQNRNGRYGHTQEQTADQFDPLEP